MRRSLVLALLLTGCAASVPAATGPASPAPSAAASPPAAPSAGPKNVVFMIADGFGPASATMGRAAGKALDGRAFALDGILVGSSETSSSDSRVTDSAAGATAYSCGLKTYNGAIAVDRDGAPCRTVLEAAEARGMATGLVVTSRITHATPASFAAHVPRRSQEAEIAAQMVQSGVDVMFGGGRRFFTPATEGGSRDDGRDLLGALAGAGYAVATDRVGYDRLAAVPAAALLAPNHLAYDIDRDETDQPSLREMATKALDLLAASPDGRANGFFLMIEGSRIDHAAHGNDPAAHARDILAYDETVRAVLDWAARDGNTLVVSTADHETGGMTLGRDGIYAWDPAPLLAATASTERMVERLEAGDDPARVLREGTGQDISDDVVDAVRAAIQAHDLGPVGHIIRDVESEPAGIAWTTSGHTAVDVNLYAFGPGSDRFVHAMANAAVGRAVFDALGL